MREEIVENEGCKACMHAKGLGGVTGVWSYQEKDNGKKDAFYIYMESLMNFDRVTNLMTHLLHANTQCLW